MRWTEDHDKKLATDTDCFISSELKSKQITLPTLLGLTLSSGNKRFVMYECIRFLKISNIFIKPLNSFLKCFYNNSLNSKLKVNKRKLVP